MPIQVHGVLVPTITGSELSPYEPNSNDGEYSRPFGHIQYKRTPILRPIATLAMFRCRHITKCR
jgi:hypothetical protein